MVNQAKDPEAISPSRSKSAAGTTELASRRTEMAFQRTRMSADRTLMAVIRTALTLTGFGFTIFQFFQKLHETGTLTSGSPRNFGLALVVLGVAMLVVGILYHVRFMLGLRRQRAGMVQTGLIHGQSNFPMSLTLIVAVLLLLVALLAVMGMSISVGPFA